MKFSLTMKCPDAFDIAAKYAILDDNPGISDIDLAEQTSATKDVCAKWFRYGEQVTLEIDTEAGTCIVKENS